MSKKSREKAKVLQESAQFRWPDGEERETTVLEWQGKTILLPKDASELVEAFTQGDRIGLMARVGDKFRSWFKGRTSDPEALTTSTSPLSYSAALTGGLVGDYFDSMKIEGERLSKYRDFERIDNEDVELSRGLDVTVGYVFSSREGDQESYRIKSKDARVQKILEDMDKRLELPKNLPEICRSGLKYGDDFEERIVDESNVVVYLKWLNPRMVVRNEDKDGKLDRDHAFTFKKDAGSAGVDLADWQVSHFRHSPRREDPYGRSFFSAARKSFRQCEGAENGMLIALLTRAADRDVFLIPSPRPMSTMTEADAKLIVDSVKSQLKRRALVDPNTGKFEERRSPMADNEDLYLLTHRDNPADVKRLNASSLQGQIPVVEYFQNKKFTATGVPKSYLGIERDVNAKATLSWQDIAFARIVRDVQREMVGMQRDLYDFQLVMLGIVPTEELYDVIYPPVSFVDEEMRINIESLKWQIAGSAKQALQIPTRWLLANVIKLSDGEVEKLAKSIEDEEAAFQSQQQAQGFPGMGWSPGESLESVRRNRKLVDTIEDLRDKIVFIQRHRLAEHVSLKRQS